MILYKCLALHTEIYERTTIYSTRYELVGYIVFFFAQINLHPLPLFIGVLKLPNEKMNVRKSTDIIRVVYFTTRTKN